MIFEALILAPSLGDICDVYIDDVLVPNHEVVLQQRPEASVDFTDVGSRGIDVRWSIQNTAWTLVDSYGI